ncbi:MAG: bifunctional oligoribonuclease/PAP phosphatase NrnA [Candidatus Peribacteraceae bacterium]|nr:bifunctional oligoribonuclease/PAP phosphatase NrnA [Candidatus Peribacteraceae bacterium]
MPLSSTDIQTATTVIEQAQKILILPHANPDPDALGSALACYSLFRSLGKECTVVCADTLPESLKFLPNAEILSTTLKEEQECIITLDCSDGVEIDKLRYTVEDKKVNIIILPKKGRISSKNVSVFSDGSRYDLILVIDTADLPLLGSTYSDHTELFSTVPVLNVDHHISNTQFGQTHLIDPMSASATEVLYHWFLAVPQWKDKVTPDIATLLLTGLITDTRSFQNPNTTPRSLEVAANLLDMGARQQEIIQHVYKTKPLSTLKIWGRALNRIQVDPEARIVWSTVSRDDFAEMGSTSKETQGILDELISTVPDADVHALFTEVEDGGFKASLRSSAAIDVNVMAGRLFGGGGHSRASGFKVKQYPNFQLKVIECIQQMKAEAIRQRGEGERVEQVAVKAPVAKPVPQSRLQEPMKPSLPSKPAIDVVGELNR